MPGQPPLREAKATDYRGGIATAAGPNGAIRIPTSAQMLAAAGVTEGPAPRQTNMSMATNQASPQTPEDGNAPTDHEEVTSKSSKFDSEIGEVKDRDSSVKAPDMVDGSLDLRKKITGRRPSAWRITDTLALQRFRHRHPIRGFLRMAVAHPIFDSFFAGVVIFSVVLIGWEIEAQLQDPDDDTNFFLFCQCACCFFFSVEVCFRIGAHGKSFFFNTFSSDYKWNIFDTVCLFTMVIELMSALVLEVTSQSGSSAKQQATQFGTSGRILRVLRLLRIVRALRIMRATRASREFRKMSYALQYSAQTLFWALLLLGFVMYFFATTFTQAVSEVLVLQDVKPQDVLEDSKIFRLLELWGSIPLALKSLFMAISGGRDWYELMEPLTDHLHWAFASLFIVFIAVTIFGIMNVLTSVFVESALQSVQHYKDLLIQESMKSKKMYVDHLREVFNAIDTDKSGSITMSEMEQFLIDPSLCMYLESMDIQPDDARTLFRLLDKDESGSVSIEEFCQGCLRLKGDAKSFDIHCIIFENHRMLHKWKEYMIYMERGFMPSVLKIFENSMETRFGPAEDPAAFLVPGFVNAAQQVLELAFDTRRQWWSIEDEQNVDAEAAAQRVSGTGIRVNPVEAVQRSSEHLQQQVHNSNRRLSKDSGQQASPPEEPPAAAASGDKRIDHKPEQLRRFTVPPKAERSSSESPPRQADGPGPGPQDSQRRSRREPL